MDLFFFIPRDLLRQRRRQRKGSANADPLQLLLCLKTPNHGYGIVQTVERLTEGAIKLAPGTMYGSLSKMEKDGLIRFVREEEKRKIYEITDLGREVLQTEIARIERLYRIAQEGK